MVALENSTDEELAQFEREFQKLRERLAKRAATRAEPAAPPRGPGQRPDTSTSSPSPRRSSIEQGSRPESTVAMIGVRRTTSLIR